MMEDFKMNLLQGKYKAAEEICKSMDANSVRDMIMTIAYDTENICVYCFIQYMIKRTGRLIEKLNATPAVALRIT